MTSEELNDLVEQTLKRNRAVVRRARERSRQRRREIERTALAMERAIRRLRQGSPG